MEWTDEGLNRLAMDLAHHGETARTARSRFAGRCLLLGAGAGLVALCGVFPGSWVVSGLVVGVLLVALEGWRELEVCREAWSRLSWDEKARIFARLRARK